MAVSANRLELLQIADAVAREKAIDREIVIDAMADAIQKAARSQIRFGIRISVRKSIPKTGEIKLQRLLEVVEAVEDYSTQIAIELARDRQSGEPSSENFICRAAAADGFRPHRGPVRQAGHCAEGSRSRA